jgi:hypothetical protein
MGQIKSGTVVALEQVQLNRGLVNSGETFCAAELSLDLPKPDSSDEVRLIIDVNDKHDAAKGGVYLGQIELQLPDGGPSTRATENLTGEGVFSMHYVTQPNDPNVAGGGGRMIVRFIVRPPVGQVNVNPGNRSFMSVMAVVMPK